MEDISKKRLAELERAERKLQALEAGGVDNWEWYGESLEKMGKQDEFEEDLEELRGDIEEIFGLEGDQPAGPGAGYGLTLSGQDDLYKSLFQGVLKLVKKYKEIDLGEW